MLRGSHLRITREGKPGYIGASGAVASQPQSWLLIQHYEDWHPQEAGEVVALTEAFNPNTTNNIGGSGALVATVDLRSVAVAIGRLRARLLPSRMR